MIDATRVPIRQRDAFVRMAVRRAAPFPDPDFGLAWSGGRAAVWYWSRARAMTLAGDPPASARFQPEALFLGGARSDGVEMLALREGLEARVWREGALVADRWWPSVPDPAQWQDFLRGSGLPAATAMPVAVETALTGSPWGGKDSLDIARQIAPYLPQAAAVAGVVILAAFALRLGQIAQAGWELRAAQAEVERLGEDLQRILAARERADAAQASIDRLLSLRPPAAQTTLMAALAEAMPTQDWRVSRWSLPNREAIEVTMTMPQPDPESIVAGWEASPHFRDVAADLSRRSDEIVVRARIASGDEASP